MQNSHRSFRKNKSATSPAISTVILMASAVVMILVAMTYANNILSLKMAENEFNTNKQFMQTTGQQIDDIAWTIGRAQTVSYSIKYGNVEFQEVALDYTFQVHTSTEGWKTLSLSGEDRNNPIQHACRLLFTWQQLLCKSPHNCQHLIFTA